MNADDFDFSFLDGLIGKDKPVENTDATNTDSVVNEAVLDAKESRGAVDIPMDSVVNAGTAPVEIKAVDGKFIIESSNVESVTADSTNPKAAEPEIDFEFESQKLLFGVEAELQKVESEFLTQRKQLDELKAAEKELQRQLLDIARRKREFDASTFDIQTNIRRMRRDADDYRRRYELDKENKKQRDALAAERTSILEDTKNCAWVKDAMPFQVDGAVYAAVARRCIIADSMGLGKTLESIMYCDMVKAKKVLVICPGEVMSGFQRSFKRWAPQRDAFVIGRKPKVEQQAILNNIDDFSDNPVVIVNYESWARNKALLDWIADARFDTIILDEAHRIKEGQKQTFQGVHDIVFSEGWAVPNVLCMTGTPILNKPEEIFTSLQLVAPDLFQRKTQFHRDFCDWTGKEWGPGGQARLAQAISGMYIRRVLSDTGIKLPPQELIVHEIELDEETYALQAELLEMLRHDAQIKTESGEVASIPSMLALITRQRQATVWPGGIWINVEQYGENGEPLWEVDEDTGEYVQVVKRVNIGKDYQQSVKIDTAIELFEELTDSGIRVAFFSQFKEALKEVGRRLGDRVVEFTGDTPISKRDEIKRNFDASYGEDPKWEGILCHYATGGVGLNLTAAQAIIILDEEWNEGKATQAYDRIHRIGQTQETQVHILRHVGPGYSIDKWLADMIERKAKIVGGFNSSVDQYKGAFTFDNK